MKQYTYEDPFFPGEVFTRTELSEEVFKKICERITYFLENHEDAWNIHRNDDERLPILGKGVRLHNIENGTVRQFNMHFWYRPRNMHVWNGMKELGEIVFFYTKPENSNPSSSGEVDHYTLYKGNVITHAHQDLESRVHRGVNRAMWPRPDLTDKTARELLDRLEKIFVKEKS